MHLDIATDAEGLEFGFQAGQIRLSFANGLLPLRRFLKLEAVMTKGNAAEMDPAARTLRCNTESRMISKRFLLLTRFF